MEEQSENYDEPAGLLGSGRNRSRRGNDSQKSLGPATDQPSAHLNPPVAVPLIKVRGWFLFVSPEEIEWLTLNIFATE